MENSIGFDIGASNTELQKNLEVSFEMDATYDDFLNFLIDLEHSLRIVDIVSLSFDSKTVGSATSDVFESGLGDANGNQNDNDSANPEAPRYTFQIALRTYWVDDK